MPGHGGAEVPLFPLAGRTVTISAGGTREPLDPVRFLGNRSSGKQGVALAAAARDAGATVRLVAAHMEVPAPAGVELVEVETALQLREAVAGTRQPIPTSSSWPPRWRTSARQRSPAPKSRSGTTPPTPSSRLSATPTSCMSSSPSATPAATASWWWDLPPKPGTPQGDVLAYAEAKLKRKGCDLLVVNHVGTDKVFGQDHNSVVILSRAGSEPQSASGSKQDVAAVVIDRISAELSQVFPRT